MSGIPSFHHDGDPEAMTRRARWYLTVAATRHFSLGVFCLWFGWMFRSPVFIPVIDYLPIAVWGVLMIIIGFLCGLAAALRSGGWARLGIVSSATITTVLAVGIGIGVSIIYYDWFTLGVYPSQPPSPVIPILLASLAAKDFIVAAQPIRSPFETVVRLISGD